MMIPMSLSEFEVQQEYNHFQHLVKECEYLSKEDYEFVKAYDEDAALNFTYIGDYSSYSDYLNLNLYSEYDDEKREYEY